MSATASTIPTRPGPELSGQTIVVIGGSGGIGLETARRARAEGASVILTGRNPERLERAARELGAERTAAFDANDPAPLQSFFQDLPNADRPCYGHGRRSPLSPSSRNVTQRRHARLTEHLLLALNVARGAADKVRPAGSLIFMGARARAARGLASHRVDSHRRVSRP